MAYKFRSQVRGFVDNLCELMQFANGQDSATWSYQGQRMERNGVFGYAFHTVWAIIKAECNEPFADQVMNSIEFGGNETWLDDLEAHIQDVLDHPELY